MLPGMKRFRHLLASLALGLVSITTQAADKPNVILIMCDDLGWGDVGFNGNKIIRTPHLDAMAKAGLKFNRFYAAAPVCSPTRGSCITGRHPYRYGIPFANSGHMKPEELTLAELLKKQGYATGHFGKWHLGTLTKTVKDANRGGPRGTKHFSPPQANGFDVCFSTESKVPTWDPLLRPKGNNSSKWWDAVSGAGEAKPYGTAYWNERGESVTENTRGDNSRVIMDRTIPFIRNAARRGQPFFGIVWFHAPHLPVVAGPRHAAMYAEHPKYTQHYYGCITALDEQVGRLRAELRALGVADHTLLFFCSDNGPEGKAGSAPGTAAHFSGRKRSLLEGGIRVPGIVEWPGRVKTDRTTDIPCVTSDYLPTIIDLVSAKPVANRPIDGISLVPLLDGKLRKRGQPIGFESKGQLAWIDGRYKLYRNSSTAAEFMLFDLVADPSEKTDLAKAKPNLAKRLIGELAAWRASCQASATGKDY